MKIKVIYRFYEQNKGYIDLTQDFITSSYFRSQMRCAQVYAVFLSALVALKV